MSEFIRTSNIFDTLSNVLFRCWLFGFSLLAFWFLMFAAAGETIHDIHGKMFGLTKHELELIFYCGMGLLKLLVIVIFFIPWLSLRVISQKSTK